MNVRNCRKCNRLFNYIAGLPICPACKEELEVKFQEVKAFIQENNSVPLTVVAEKCDVDVAQLHQWVREERLVFSADSVTGIACEVCGVSILTGRYCDKCKAETMKDFMSAGRHSTMNGSVTKKSTTDPAKMRFLNKDGM